jgi:hypothetical protein
MTPDLERLLVTRYPLIFPDNGFPPRSGVANGWFGLLDAPCARLQWWTDQNHAPQLVMRQTKEKYGELRIHVSPLYDPARPCDPPRAEQQGMIWMASALSLRTCEVCGAPGRWIGGIGPYIRCAEHERRRVQEPVPVLFFAPPVPIDERGTEIGDLRGVLLLADHTRRHLAAPTLAELAAEAREIGREPAQLVHVRPEELPTKRQE